MVVAALKRASRVAEEVGVKLALEMISPAPAGSLVATIRQAREMIEEAGASNISILLGTWHGADGSLLEIVGHIDHIVGIRADDRADLARRPWLFLGPGSCC